MGIDSAILEDSARRLFPDLDMEQILAQLLLERAQKSLIKYRTMAHRFEVKYGQDFGTFRQKLLATEPPFDMEQDYFDWEMAVTGITDMEEEIARLERVQQQA